MAFDYVQAFNSIQDNLDECMPSRFMVKILDVCSRLYPDPAWKYFQDLEYDSEVRDLSLHVVNVLKEEPADFEAKGFWFGLNNPVLESGKTSADLYFSVCSDYSAEEGSEWYCELMHYPERGSFNSKILKEIYEHSYETTGLKNMAEYPLCLAYGIQLARSAMLEYKASKSKGRVGYAIGFDSGDLFNMGLV